MKHKQTGFTLIELMIVVSIIGILASIAMGFYSDYTKRAHTAEGLYVSEYARLAVITYHNTHNAFPASNAIAGIDPAEDIHGNAVSKVEVKLHTDGETGLIEVTFNEKVITGDTIVYEISASEGSTQWDCTGGTLLNIYRPKNCR